jgi:hypothetical protein
MSHAILWVAYRQQRKATAEQRMGRVGNLDLGRFFLTRVIEVGTKLMVRRASLGWTTTKSGSGSAWHRHITLCLLAHALVGVLRSEEVRKRGTPEDLLPLTLPEVRRLLCSLLLARLPEERAVLSWSCWRRRHQLRAKRCHY